MLRKTIFVVICAVLVFSIIAGCQTANSGGENTQPTEVPQEPTPSGPPSEDQTLTNLVAFTRLYGYIRYFHPSSEARNLDWDQVAYNGIPSVIDAANPEELAQKLEDFFRPCAPTLQVYPLTNVPEAAVDMQVPTDVENLNVVMWRHFSIDGDLNLDFYHSDLASARLVGGSPPESFHDPYEPFEAELGGGVAVRMPLALFADQDGTYPRSAETGEALPDFSSNPDDLTRRLAAVVIAWNAMQHFYPYFDVVETDWEDALLQALTGTMEAEDEVEYYYVLRQLSSQLNDGHSGVRWPDDPNVFTPNVIVGWYEESAYVIYAAGTAAEYVSPGDRIVSIDGKDSAERMAELMELYSGATTQWLINKALLYFLLGAEGSSVTLEIESPSGEQSAVTLVREIEAMAIYTPEVLNYGRPESIAELEPGIMYVDLTRVSDGELNSALPQLEEAIGVVFDVRGYPKVSPDSIGYLTEETVTSPLMAIPNVKTPDQQDTVYDFTSWDVQPRSPHLTGTIVFLIDEKAISYAETYMSMIAYYDLAVIVGTPTAGTNGNVNPFTIPGGYSFNWTGMKVLNQDGSQFHGIGIQPDIYVERSGLGFAEGRDEQLEAAIEVINQEQ